MARMTESEAGSFYNYLSDGCKLCQKGAKMVLFITGICGRDCFYCPLSEDRRRDVTYANEELVIQDSDVIEQARLMNALGTGITGGEPLARLEHVLHYIELLKSEFGPEHHIHLYTSTAANRDTLSKLAEAGLDEIRFHPPLETWNNLEDTPFADAIRDAIDLNISTGVEIPSIKGVESVQEFIDKMGGFLNLNELEFSDTNAEDMKDMGFELQDDISNAVLDSGKWAKAAAKKGAKFHFCSSRYKDTVQLRKRLLRIAENTARPFDEITDEGTLIYAVIKEEIEKVASILRSMDIPDDMYEIRDETIETAWWILEDVGQELKDNGSVLSIVEKYPFEDGMIVETIPV